MHNVAYCAYILYQWYLEMCNNYISSGMWIRLTKNNLLKPRSSKARYFNGEWFFFCLKINPTLELFRFRLLKMYWLYKEWLALALIYWLTEQIIINGFVYIILRTLKLQIWMNYLLEKAKWNTALSLIHSNS